MQLRESVISKKVFRITKYLWVNYSDWLDTRIVVHGIKIWGRGLHPQCDQMGEIMFQIMAIDNNSIFLLRK